MIGQEKKISESVEISRKELDFRETMDISCFD